MDKIHLKWVYIGVCAWMCVCMCEMKSEEVKEKKLQSSLKFIKINGKITFQLKTDKVKQIKNK